MIFNKLRLQNFGLFCGQHEFDLTPRKKYNKACPMVLFGGKNGSGKTTILEAVMLCIYGRNALDNNIAEAEYAKYLEGRIHRPRGIEMVSLNSAHIELEFSHAHFGEERTYTIKRSWKRKGKKVNEELSLLRDGVPLPDVEANFAQDFLKDLIPIGVSRLFFFDGEKIQDLANDETVESTLASSIKAMLNLDVVERLQGDLHIYLNREKKKGQIKVVEKRLAEEEKTIKELEEQVSYIGQDRAQIEVQLAQINNKIEEAEAAFLKDGSVYAKGRSGLQKREADLAAEIESLESRIRTLCMEFFPFTLVPDLCKGLTEQLEEESAVRQWTSAESLIRENKRRIESSLGRQIERIVEQIDVNIPSNEESDTLRKNMAKQIKMELSQSAEVGELLLKSIKPDGKSASKKIVHADLSEADVGLITNWVSSGIPATQKELGNLGVQLEEKWVEVRDIRLEIQKAPEEDVIAGRVSEIKQLTFSQGELSNAKKQKEQELKSAEYKLNEAKRQYQKTLDDLTVSEDIIDRIDMTQKVQGVLQDYLKDLSRSKVKQLESAVANAFTSLHRKGDMIRRIEVDPDTFAVTLLNRENRPIAKKELSAGEKQIYAVAMLWALAQISGRPLPVIIDTPLGRLDSEHRRHLIENYFPKASHQVIILSTDTEIDSSYFKDLNKHISHAYHLEFSPDTESTEAREGYFWKQNTEDLIDEPEQNQDLLRGIGAA